MSDEPQLHHLDGGAYNDQPCTCTGKCLAACDGECGCEALLRAWIDAELDRLIATIWAARTVH
jgi:hypothetical protein